MPLRRDRALALLALLVPTIAFAARPFTTDDARIVDPGGYQIETYVKDQRRTSETEYWFLPAANFGGALDRFEFTLGGNVVRSQPNGDSNLVQAQVKTLLRPLARDGVGFAATIGVVRVKPGSSRDPTLTPTPFGFADVPASDAGNKVHYDPFVNAISSVSVLDDRAVFHFNLGALRDTSADITRRNWGVGTEVLVRDRLYAIAESYGVSGEKPAYQLGGRYWLVPGRLQVDGTVGRQDANPDRLRWISIGLRMLW